MDTEAETQKFKTILAVGVIFLISLFKSCTELRYTISGVETEAVVDKIFDTIEGRRSFTDHWAVQYRFKAEDGKRYLGRFEVPVDEAEGYRGEKLRVVYLPSDPDTSSVVERRSMVWPTIFLVMSAFFGFSLYRLSRP